MSVFDDQRRFSPRYDEAEINRVEVDSVILAIGQKADLGCVAETPVAVDRGRLQCDRASMTTSERGVFACGEVMTGPGSAINAIATGHDAAKVIAHFLETGEKLRLHNPAVTTIGELPKATAALAKRFERVEVNLADPAERIMNFSPIEPGYSEAEALTESRRCLACATGAYLQSPEDCAGCLTCVRVCPFRGGARWKETAVCLPRNARLAGFVPRNALPPGLPCPALPQTA